MDRKALKILLVSNNLWSLAEGMFGPLFALFANRVGGSILDVTWAWSGYLIVRGVASILVGKISDRWISKKSMMVGGFALNALLTFGYLSVSNRWGLLLVESGLGLAAALALPTWSSLFARYSGRTKNGWAWGLATGTDDFVTAVGIILGGLVVSQFSFTGLFVIMGFIQLIATTYLAKILYYVKLPMAPPAKNASPAPGPATARKLAYR